MTFCWAQFVEIAEYLKEQGDTNEALQEAAYRCSVSRAYYGAYRHAENYAKDTGQYVPNSTGADHSALRIWFKDKDMAEITRYLSRLHQWRKDCDYNEPLLKITDLSQYVRTSISEAWKVIDALT
ncbi:MAG: hypothetical protein GX216_11360 [Methanomicrobiales archaeon]|jgi:hypothetical protein|nr:hypothetical protein [Methanomicrobiales archaeon]